MGGLSIGKLNAVESVEGVVSGVKVSEELSSPGGDKLSEEPVFEWGLDWAASFASMSASSRARFSAKARKIKVFRFGGLPRPLLGLPVFGSIAGLALLAVPD